MSGPVLRAVIADSDREARAAIRLMLSAVPSVAVAGEYDNATDAALKAAASRPDIVLVEVPVDPAHGDPASVIERLARRHPSTSVPDTRSSTASRVSSGWAPRCCRA